KPSQESQSSSTEFLVTTTTTSSSTTVSDLQEGSLEEHVRDIMNHLLDAVETKLLNESNQSARADAAVNQCVSDLVDSVTAKMTVAKDSQQNSLLASVPAAPQKKTSPARPTSLDITRSYDQSARNQF